MSKLTVKKRRVSSPPSSKLYIAGVMILAAFYLCLVFIPGPDASTLQHYHLSNSAYRGIILPIIIFLLAIWVASFYGALMASSYTHIIGRSKDGHAFRFISRGLLLLALTLPVSSCLTSVVNLVGRTRSTWLETLTIVNNYINIALMAAALLLIAIGAEKLGALIQNKIKPWPERLWVFIFIVFSSTYGYLLVSQPMHNGFVRRVYYLPHWLTLVTMAIPYLYVWYRGLWGAQIMYQYQKNVGGKLYKQALRHLAAGISIVILSSIVARTLTTTSTRLSGLSVGPVLIIIYAFLGLMAVGYILIASGAKKLKKIEEV